MKRNSAAKIKKAQGTNIAKEGTNGKPSFFITFVLGNVAMILKIGAVFFAALFALIIWRKSTSVIKDLVNADADALKAAVFGDVPHLFYCDRGGIGKGVSSSDKIPAIFADLHVIKGSEIGFATLNCSRVLPSGKSVWDRFKIKKEWRPTIFGTAPWMKPKQAGPNYLKDIASLRKFVEVAMAPRGTDISSDKQLAKFCGFDKTIVDDETSITDTCFVLMKGTRVSKAVNELEGKLVKQFPKLRIASIDASKRRLSFEDYEDLTPDLFSMKIYALRNGTHHLSMVYPTTADYMSTFVSHAVGIPLNEFSSSEGGVRLLNPAKQAAAKRMKEQAAAAASARKAAAAASAAAASSKASASKGGPTAAADEKTAEISEAERIRKERQRREEMERQEKEQFFQQGGGEDEDGDAGEDEEEYIELL